MRYGSIYIITNKLNGKQYVGQTIKSVQERFKAHCIDKRNRHISKAIQKYEVCNFSIQEIFSCCSLADLNDMEIYFVEKLNTLHPNGYNHRAGGNQNGICSKELRDKISAAKIGKPLLKRRGEVRSKEQRLKISRTLGGLPVKAINIKTGEIKHYDTVTNTKIDGHNPSNVVSICKGNSYRTHSKNWKFEYANQSGSKEIKKSLHAQRIDLETDNTE